MKVTITEYDQMIYRSGTKSTDRQGMIAPGARPAYRVETEPLVLSPLAALPSAVDLDWTTDLGTAGASRSALTPSASQVPTSTS